MSSILKGFAEAPRSADGTLIAYESTPLDIAHNQTRQSWWLILDCGHWYHWTGEFAPKHCELDCPSCNLPVVVHPAASEGA